MPSANFKDLSKSVETEIYSFPLSFAQERMWFLDQLQPGLSVYNMATTMRIKVPLNVRALERSVNEIVRRHEALRTSFGLVEGQARQLVRQELRIPLGVIDLRGLGAEEREQERKRLAVEEGQRPFDLTRGPLLRLSLLRLGESEHEMLLTMHHIVSDGWSLGVFLRELGVLYEAYAMGQGSPLAELPVQYADFAQWQREQLSGAVLEQQLG